MFNKLRNKKFNKGIEFAQKRVNELYKNKSESVICFYCKQLMLKNEATIVYNMQTDEMECSHEKCWNENNIVHEGMPQPIREH